MSAHRHLFDSSEPATGVHRIERAGSVRGTVIMSSQQSVRDAGLFERYAELVEPAERAAVLSPLATEWLPVSVAVAHYRACERLGLSDSAIDTLARSTGSRINTIYLRGMLRLTDTTPRFAWSHAQRIWSRTWAGSTLEVSEAGPKDVRVELVGSECCEIPYFRRALGGFFARNTELFCRRAFWKPAPGVRQPQTVAYIVSWV